MTDETSRDEPEEGDLYTHDHHNVFVWGSPSRKPALVIKDVNRFDAEVAAFMKKDRFWPSVWFISDHGNAHLIAINKK